ncbi:Predicted DNA-binding protein, MmcQ/YjbR family [Bryocella elongata]|uniref:Predicted DNA-binding protein, MmcQ/YjbR family n=1 Tax=Bryocella elongata TaxID=863522 RepID=A0A1H5YG99_9BACT|nr:MmcQ/YjbR family DNA-binding protein [Bryocella elongata]SEG22742.1 Predicted DNA-binding protein, MmcQ/YjbR family [Bryocella elongata]
MDVERARAILLKLPHVVETMQWGDNLVFWVGDKAIGGKMFALINLSPDAQGAVSFAAGPERFAELVEIEGFRPAPYFARIHWVAAEHWDLLRPTEWQTEFANAHNIVHAKMPKRVRELLLLPVTQQKKLIVEGRKKAAQKAARKKS